MLRTGPPSKEELLALLRKYETIAQLRRRRIDEGKVAERSTLRALAREFPGALRELDTVTLEDVDARVKALAEAAQGGPLATWIEWMVAYHATMRAALLVKARVARSRVLSDELARRAGEEASRVSGVEVDDTFVHTVARPPRGRLNVVVFERLGQKFGVSPEEIWEALFPARRAGRY